VHFQDTPGPIGRTVADVATTLDALAGYDPEDPFTFGPGHMSIGGGYARALDVDLPLTRWRIGVLESGFGSDRNPDMEPVNRLVRAAVGCLGELDVPITPGLQIPELPRWITDTAGYVQQSKSDLDGFLAGRPAAPVSRFMEVYESGRFHPLNDLFHGIAQGPEKIDEAEYRRIRRSQEDFQELILGVLADHRVDFLVYPTVQVIPPTRNELAAAKYECLTFPTNTVIASQAGMPALTMPVGFTEDGLPVGMELLGTPFSEASMLQFAHAWERSTSFRRAPTL
jgi:amidase